MKDMNGYTNWTLAYRNDLNMLSNDLELLLNKNFKIFIAIDFADIYGYCFPSDMRLHKNKKGYHNLIKLEVSRSALFFMLKNIYMHPVILLPPYLREANNFLKFLSRTASKFIVKDMDLKFIFQVIERVSLDYRNTIGTDEIEKLIGLINLRSPELLFFFSRNLNDGVEVLMDILKNFVDPDPSIFGNEFSKRSLERYFSIDEELSLKGNNELLSKFQILRNDELKHKANVNDAEAIRYIMEINKVFLEEKKLIFLASSAPIMNRLRDFYADKEFAYKVDGIEFHTLRDVSFFYTILLELSRLYIYNKEKIDSNHIDIKEFKKIVDQDLAIVEKFLFEDSELALIGGSLADTIQNENLENFINLNKIIENIDLSLHIEDFLPKENKTKDYRYLLHFSDSSFYDEIFGTLSLIQKNLSNEDFKKRIFDKSIELEKQRMSYLWSLKLRDLSIFYREIIIEIILFDLPFQLYLKDKDSKRVVVDLINRIEKCKQEIKAYNDISKESLDAISSQLIALFEEANDLDDDEKYIIWGLVFFSLGRLDLFNNFYTQLSCWVKNEYVKRDLSYLYILSFIKTTQKKGMQKKVQVKEILAICDKNYKKQYDLRANDLKADLIFYNMTELRSQLEKKNIVLPEDIQMDFINHETILISGIQSGLPKIILLQKKDNNIQLSEIDIRFAHLKLWINSIYLSNYLGLDPKQKEEMNDCLEQILIPVAEKFFPEYQIPFCADFAYLLANDDSDSSSELSKSLDLMRKIEKFSDSLYWNYSIYYIYGFIYYKISIMSNDNSERNARNAIIYLHKSLNEIPQIAVKQRKIVHELLKKCQLVLDSKDGAKHRDSASI